MRRMVRMVMVVTRDREQMHSLETLPPTHLPSLILKKCRQV